MSPLSFRPYQLPVFRDRSTGLLLLHWSRQIGKSFTLAGWAVDRLLTQLQRFPTWLVTVLSNSRDNGAEFVLKTQEICARLGVVLETVDQSPDLRYENMRMETRLQLGPHSGRIKVLAANPRTARGFSGDLILDEFAFHENSQLIWEAAEPILSANPEFLCRIASTGNGKNNLFYRLSAGEGPSDGTFFITPAGLTLSRVTRTAAWQMGVPIYHPSSRKAITPDQARALALDKRAYDQNYECAYNDEASALLTWELISAAERPQYAIDEQAWSAETLQRLDRATGPLHGGLDIGRERDLSVLPVLETHGHTRRLVALLRMAGLRLPDQQRQLDLLFRRPKFQCLEGDMTGLGLGLVEYAQESWGPARVRGVNFAATEPLNPYLIQEGRWRPTARVTEIMATNLLAAFEDRALELCVALDPDARNDLRKPERVTTPGGRVSIAATRDAAGHADHFWGLALAWRAATQAPACDEIRPAAAAGGWRAPRI